jgi:hypothetical protein
MYSELHQSFFTSLGIPLLANAVWPVLTREKGPQNEVLIHSKNQALLNFPIGIKITRDEGEDWSSKSSMGKLI